MTPSSNPEAFLFWLSSNATLNPGFQVQPECTHNTTPGSADVNE